MVKNSERSKTSTPQRTTLRQDQDHEDVNVALLPHGPHHYELEIENGPSYHAEYLFINNAKTHLEDEVAFSDISVTYGVALDGPGDSIYLWI